MDMRIERGMKRGSICDVVLLFLLPFRVDQLDELLRDAVEDLDQIIDGHFLPPRRDRFGGESCRSSRTLPPSI